MDLPHRLVHRHALHRHFLVQLHCANTLRLQERVLQQTIGPIDWGPTQRITLKAKMKNIEEPGVANCMRMGKEEKRNGGERNRERILRNRD